MLNQDIVRRAVIVATRYNCSRGLPNEFSTRPHHPDISPVYTTNLPPYSFFEAFANTRIMPSQESSTETGAFSPIPKAWDAPLPISVETWPGSNAKQLSQSSSALMRIVYQLSAVLVGAYAALGMGRWLLGHGQTGA